MRQIKIVTDSSANLFDIADVAFAAAPLKVSIGERAFIDSPTLDVDDMIAYMEQYKGRSQTSCPNTSDWLTAFGNADDIICVTITSAISGTYNSAYSAAQIYESEHEGRRVFVLDSLTTGPELRLAAEKLREYILIGKTFEDICTDIQDYIKSTGLYFMLKSLKNFANNGRVSPTVARIAGFMGICIVGRASEEGTLEPTDKCRGEARSFAKICERLSEAGLSSGRVSIAHCQNEIGAETLRELLAVRFPRADISVSACNGLCSYYAEAGGILVGFEKM